MTLRLDTTWEGPRVTVRLAGRVRGEDLGELRRQIAAGNPSVVLLDLEEVTLVDVEAVRFLEGAAAGGVALLHCPPFIRAWMEGERDGARGQAESEGFEEAAMGTTEVRSGEATGDRSDGKVDMKLEVVVLPVSDVDRAKRFYAGLGWRLDADFSGGGGRVVQFTPPGSDCSVHFGTKLTSAAPGCGQNLFLVVSDLRAARDALARHGAQVSEVFHFAGFDRVDPAARLSGPSPDWPSYGAFVSFSDPDGNSWLVQEITTRLPGRIDPATTAFGSKRDLEAALRRAEAAHGEHEKRTGQRDENWPDWYAAYMAAEQAGGPLPT